MVGKQLATGEEDQANLRTRSVSRFAIKRILYGWWVRTDVGGKLALTLIALALVAGFTTFAVLSGLVLADPAPRILPVLLQIDLAILLLLGAVIAQKVARLWGERRRGLAGSRLHVRFVLILGLLTVTPAIFVSVFSVFFLNNGLEYWFNERLTRSLREAEEIAQAYLREHAQTIQGDILALAVTLRSEGLQLARNPEAFQQFLVAKTRQRGLSNAMVFEESGRVLARAGYAFVRERHQGLNVVSMEKARAGGVAIMLDPDDARVHALIKLDGFIATYLYIGRWVDPLILNYIERARNTMTTHQAMAEERNKLQILFSAAFASVTLILLLAASWCGLFLAQRISRPIRHLIGAAESIQTSGQVTHVKTNNGPDYNDEIGLLAQAFNRMVDRIESQRNELLNANELISMRHRLIEAVLEGVSAGVFALDQDQRIKLCNRTALRMISQHDLNQVVGLSLKEYIPEIDAIVERADRWPDRVAESEIKIRRGFNERIYLMRGVAEVDSDKGCVEGYVITCDDISEWVAAQRMAAWADIAQRVAHEIKNPLTPIQLAAERLRRRQHYAIKEGRIPSSDDKDNKIFDDCIDTIIRQVEDIGHMVKEFSAFARLPAARRKWGDLRDAVRHAAFLHATAQPGIRIQTDIPNEPLWALFDSHQIGQALTNLIQNAIQAIESLADTHNDRKSPVSGQIMIRLFPSHKDRIGIDVTDDGPGISQDMQRRLTEPYVTTRPDGTGLGLAIVRKIIEDHRGELRIENRSDSTGTTVKIVLPGKCSDDMPEVAISSSPGLVDKSLQKVELTTHTTAHLPPLSDENRIHGL